VVKIIIMKKIFISCIAAISIVSAIAQPTAPDKLYGQLFIDVQLQKVFADGKTFVDCTPKRKVADIMYDYGMMKGANFNLKKFVEENFNLPPTPPVLNYVMQEKNVVAHINNLWSVLTREADKKIEGSSLLPLPYSYVVPGGRFREMYYWDSYFTMLGLKESKQYILLENMVKNFAYLIDTYGHIPNGTRTYYLGRSQPPFFSLMIDLLASVKGETVYKTYLPQLQKEYDYFMQGAAKLNNGEAYRYIIKTKEGIILNRYWDDMDVPRQESYAEDVTVADKACNEVAMKAKWSSEEAKEKALTTIRKNIYRNLRAAACSGLDFSNKWFADGEHIETIETINYAAVDLNALLLHLEQTIAKANTINKTIVIAKQYSLKATNREAAINKYFWNKAQSFYTDYNFITSTQSNALTPMGMFSFCFIDAKNKINMQHCVAAAKTLKEKLLKAGGLQCTEIGTHQQWDAPNGWAPMQWMSIVGLEKGGQKMLAKSIAQRWIKINKKVYLNTGKLMEKYNVVDTDLIGGGGEYPGQDGFGWTNGVLISLIKKYGE
jgi:alpha,alpha-trehalase